MRLIYALIIFSLTFFILSCGSEEKEKEIKSPSVSAKAEAVQGGRNTIEDSRDVKGVGPISDVSIDEDVDMTIAKMGKELFELNCTSCHKIDVKFIGPALKGVTNRRSPEWIMNMILEPELMTTKDPIARELLKKYISPMANQSIKKDQARKILEYFRSMDK